MSLDVSLTIGGDAGQGIQSSGAGFSLALARAGLHVFSVVDYRSRIRGGHNFYKVRVSEQPVFSHSDPVHLLLAMTEETPGVHLDNMARGGVVIYDDSFEEVDTEAIRRAGVKPFPAPLSTIAEELGSRVMMNTAALGAAAALLNVPLENLNSVIEDNFASKGDRIVSANLDVVSRMYEYTRRNGPGLDIDIPVHSGARRMLIHGNHALALGAVAGGCRFIAAYPMTPGTSIFEWMTQQADHLGIVTKQAEDELAAACMAIGAGHTGARSMTATSGGGFSLMVEAMGMAGMLEVPVVFALVQRGGPSTGLPTRTEQGDLLFAWHASQGEFPRIILAPGTVEEAYECGWRAFNLAEKYQCPVIIVSDQFLASSVRTVEPAGFHLSEVVIDRGSLLTAAELEQTNDYRRFRITENGISPRAVPGHPNAVYSVSTDEHDEHGHITESIEVRVAQMQKRMRKLDSALPDMRGPKWYGPEDANLTLVCWGSTYGPAREAVDLLQHEGKNVNLLHFCDIWPMPVDKVMEELEHCKRTVAVEQNYESQFAMLLRMTTGHVVDDSINKYDGRPISPQEIVTALEDEVKVHAG